jgi:nitrite reductase (NADH) small subunit/3-phenylpropionate/trans-cinnamate dioxygenase ferredoxin subunit
MRVARVEDVAPGETLVVTVEGRTIALCNVEGTVYAVDNACPHRGGPLGEGELDGRVLTCPWHGWRWDVTTGASVNTPGLRVGCVPVTVSGPDLLVTLP